MSDIPTTIGVKSFVNSGIPKLTLSDCGIGSADTGGPIRNPPVPRPICHLNRSTCSSRFGARIPNLPPDPDDIYPDSVKVDPKIHAAYLAEANAVPRNVVLERKRRVFDSTNLEDSLSSFNVNLRSPDCVSLSELVTFADCEYQTRSPLEWIGLGHGKPVEGFFFENGAWDKCKINEWLAEFDRFVITTYDGRILKVTVLEVFIVGEDPLLFAYRICISMRSRKLAASTAIYSLILDSTSKSVTAAQSVGISRVTRIATLARSSPSLISECLDTSFIRLLDEVSRVVSRSEFPELLTAFLQRVCSNGSHIRGLPNFRVFAKQASDAARRIDVKISLSCAAEGASQVNLQERLSSVKCSSLWGSSAAVDAVIKFRRLSLNAESQFNLFSTIPVLQPLALERFEQVQKAAILHARQTLVDNWSSEIVTLILTSFEPLGRGWFNTNEKSLQTFNLGKLKRFLGVVNFMMTDSVRVMAAVSARQFVEMIEASVPTSTTLQSLSECHNIWPSNVQRMPFFSVDVAVDEGPGNLLRIFFTAGVDKYIDLVTKMLREGVAALSDIPRIDGMVLPRLFPDTTDRVFLRGISTDDKLVVELSARLETAISKGASQLTRILELLQYLSDVLRLDASKTVEELLNDERQDISIDTTLLDDIKCNKLKKNDLLQSLPEAIHCGCFHVSLGQIRHSVAAKLDVLVELEVQTLRNRFRSGGELIEAEIKGTLEKLQQQPLDIDDIITRKSFAATLDHLGARFGKMCGDCVAIFDVLHEEFGLLMSREDTHLRWRLYGLPRKLEEATRRFVSWTIRFEKQFIEDMRSEQANFSGDIDDLDSDVARFVLVDCDAASYNKGYQSASIICAKLENITKQSIIFNRREASLGIELTDYSHVSRINKTWDPLWQFWYVANIWYGSHTIWESARFSDLDASQIDQSVTNGLRSLSKVSKYFSDRIGTDNIIASVDTLRGELENFSTKLPLIRAMRAEGIRDRHWQCISDMVGVNINPHSQLFTLSGLLSIGIAKYETQISEIADRSNKELNIERQLVKMNEAWTSICFSTQEMYRDTGTYILKGSDVALALLDEHSLIMQAMQFSSANKQYRVEIDTLSSKLVTISEALDIWLKVQRAWMYLQPIFDSPDINTQLPAEAKKFKAVDSIWRSVMARVHSHPGVMHCCLLPGLIAKLAQGLRDLDVVQKGLDIYLEAKRAAFARFYFLSNDELLEILSQARDPTCVQAFLTKVFENIGGLEFSDELSVHSMESPDGEKVPFVTSITTLNKPVEAWMGEIEVAMQEAVRNAFSQAILDFTKKARPEWAAVNVAQCVLNCSQVHWTAFVTHSICSNLLESCLAASGNDLLDLVSLVRGGLTKSLRVTIGALIVLDVHARDVVERLFQAKVSSLSDFEWISQMRFFWENDSTNSLNCCIRMAQASFPYGYEYLGNTFRLVITPLTDMCYMTLLGAQSLNLGGAPAGPAGTGKTETTKDLAKALAKQCVVFNCSPEMDYMMIGKFFKGLASSGAWCCFDEFNRINIEVLSVIAQQLLLLFGAKADMTSMRDRKMLVFEGSDILIRPAFNVFITMNPGYAGRTELPDNLQALFRPVAMMVPDYALIGEIMFYALGFTTGRNLAQKMVSTFKLASEQLSSQDHYDYGMRAVKSTIEAAGLLKLQCQELDESIILLRALRNVNVPKFLQEDIPLFEGIISDLFPGISAETRKVDHGSLEDGLRHQFTVAKLVPTEYSLLKGCQLFETLQVRHGVMLVGPAGGGKTCTIKTLKLALSTVTDLQISDGSKQKVVTHLLNPKAVPQSLLYGCFDDTTHEWYDGIAACEIRRAVRDITSTDVHWVIFDGPIDALWVESLNSVLDDNKKLCLVSGEIIALTSKVRIMFEVEDLAVASPATVSRCGMVYIEPDCLGLQPLISSWILKVPESLEKFRPTVLTDLSDILKRVLLPCIIWVERSGGKVVSVSSGTLCMQCLKLLDAILLSNFDAKNEVPLEVLQTSIDELRIGDMTACVVFAIMWSLGSSLCESSRSSFGYVLKEMITGAMNPSVIGLTMSGLENRFYDDDFDIFGYCFDFGKKEWIPWMDTVPVYTVPKDYQFEQIAVPTKDSVSSSYIIKALIKNGISLLSVGPTGCGKTSNITQILQNLSSGVMSTVVNLSAQTRVTELQDSIDARLEKRRRGVYGPPAGKKFVVFVDDVNMPAKETYGAQPPLELLRQLLDQGGWYNRTDLAFNSIVDSIIIGAMGLPGGGRTSISDRVKRHLYLIGNNEISTASQFLIFTTICNHRFTEFSEEVKSMLPKIVSGHIHLYSIIRSELLPTPHKSQYTFNMRDTWKTFLGVCSLDHKSSNSSEDVVRGWVHEVNRVFGDRLVSRPDREWLKLLVDRHVLDFTGLGAADLYNCERLLFGRIADSDLSSYKQVTDLSKLKVSIEEFLDAFNAQSGYPKTLVMFLDACEHLLRICRVLAQPMGHVLLLGVGGSGRQSLTRLASFICDLNCTQIEVARGYGLSDFREDVKKCLLRAGVDDENGTFLLSDTQIVAEPMVEIMNCIISSGDVPNLYSIEDLDRINSACKPLCLNRGLEPTKQNVFSVFLGRVVKNLHVVLCFSPIGDAFRSRLRQFPSFINCCTIDWFSEWPGEALSAVARQQIELEQEYLRLPDMDSVINGLCMIHQSAEKSSADFLKINRKKVYITPTSFLELIHAFSSSMRSRRDELNSQKVRYSSGLEKIYKAEAQVSVLQVELLKLRPILEETSQRVTEMMINIAADKNQASETQLLVSRDEEVAFIKAQETQSIKDDAQRDLEEALPALYLAVECLKKLKAEHVREVKAMTNPPGGVRLTMEAVCIMFQVKPVKKPHPEKLGVKIDDYWESSQKELLPDPKKLLDALFDFDKDNIPEVVIAKISPYMEREDFDPVVIRKASVACEALCMWTRAMVKYYHVSKAVEPKRRKLREAEKELKEVESRLADAQQRLKAVNDKIEQLESAHTKAIVKLNDLQTEMSNCEIRLERANKLLGGLSSEKLRWAAIVDDVKTLLDVLPGDCLLASGGVSYLGPFTAEFRVDLETSWRNSILKDMPLSPNCSLRNILGDAVKIQQWVVCQLPKDTVSIENGIIMDHSRRWPLLIDPQRQGVKYIKNMGRHVSELGIDVTNLSDPKLMRTLEMAIQFGKWILLENVGLELDPSLDPVISQLKVKDGQGFAMRLGDRTIPYSDLFRLFITTNLASPNYSPEISVKVTLLNFAITPDGLEDQMLAIIVGKEKPQLEEQKNALITQNARMVKQLKELEDKILQLLSESQGDVLDDDALVNAISSSKQTATEIQEKRTLALVTEREIDSARGSYRRLAYRSSILFFATVELFSIDPMYQFSLQWFQQLFGQCIDNCKRQDGELLEDRIISLGDKFIFVLYQSVCRGLFEKDKLLFSFSLCLKLLEASGELRQAYLKFLLLGSAETVSSPFDRPSWLSEKQWADVCYLDKELLPGLAESVSSLNSDNWKAFSDSGSLASLPRLGDIPLSGIDELCIIRVMAFDKLIPAISSFVERLIGRRFTEPLGVDLAVAFSDSTCFAPLIFILVAGSDPVGDIARFAADRGMGRKLDIVSLGQGQGPRASAMIDHASSSGGWVLLQNCHLAVSWLPSLERICEGFNAESTHPNFRLWLTSMPTRTFPSQILQVGVKITMEPPKGLKANLQRTYSQLSDNLWEESNKPDAFRRLLFGFAFFHAVVQDRRKYGPIGWNIPYGFTMEDFTICRKQLMSFVNDYDVPPYKVLNYLGASINYGGRVTDDKDKRLIRAILSRFICPELLEIGEQYKFSQSGIYFCPDLCVSVAQFSSYISTLPTQTPPEAFGLHENSNIICAQAEAQMILDGIVSMSSVSSLKGSKGGVVDEKLAALVAQLQNRLPSVLSVALVADKFATTYEQSLNTVLKQEVIRYNRLINVVSHSLQELQRALKGLVVMSGDLEKVGEEMMVNVVPSEWAEKGFLSLKPLSSWVSDFVDRVDFLNAWISGGIPAVFWLSGFYFPQAFLTASLQNFSRANTVAIDRLKFGFRFPNGPEPVEQPTDGGVFIRGLFLEGCGWDKKYLVPSTPKELFCSLPILHFLPIVDKTPLQHIYECPVYKVVSRRGVLSTTGHSTNFVLYLDLPSNEPESSWVIAGVAAMLSLRY